MIDPAGIRANGADPGLSKAARKAQREAARAAFWDGVWRGSSSGVASAWAHLPKILLVAIGMAVVASASAFDWWMSARGWRDLLPGVGVFAYLGAAAAVGFWYLGIHRALETAEAKDKREAWMWGAVAVAGYAICIIGVTIATATNTSVQQRLAKQSRIELAGYQDEWNRLNDKLELYPVDFWAMKVKQKTRAFDAQVAVARGTFGLPDLEIDGGCAGKLNFDQRRACAYANGGIDPSNGVTVAGARSEIEQAENDLKLAKMQEARRAELKGKIDGFTVKTGDATAAALGDYLQDAVKGNQALLGVFIVLTALFLFCGGFFSHWVWQQLGIGRKAGAKA
jgi:hypothetical protein